MIPYLFFNKNGQPLNFKWDNDKNRYNGILHFAEVSIGLFEVETIYILEKLKEEGSGQIIYGRPRKKPLLTVGDEITCKLEVEKDSPFRIFRIDNPYIETPLLNILNEPLIENYLEDNNDSIDGATGLTITGTNVPKALRIDLSLCNITEGVYIDYLDVSDTNGTILHIELYGEIIGEDERLPILLSNMGESLNHDEEFIFRSSDINEDLPNFRLLNQKRKEFLIEMHNLKPYLSAYRGIIGMIRLFGYFDLTLKEYWYDPYTETFNFEDVKLYETEKLDDPNNNMHKYKKTSLFGLFYDINSVVPDEFDDMGLPITKDNFLYSNEEVIIKLFGLKNYLKSRDIGGAAEIIDIIGEITFFNKFSFNFWVDESYQIVCNQHVQATFTTDVTDSYIRDVRDITTDFSTCPLDRHMDKTDKFYHPCFVGYFAPFYMDSPEYMDEPGIPVGMPVTLKNTTFDLKWTDAGVTWSGVLSSEMLPTWKTLAYMQHYEVEWIVNKVITETDKRVWTWSKRGKIPDMKEVDIILPLDGYYDVTIILYGYGNINSKHTKKNYLKANLKNADIVVFFRYTDKDLQRWKTNPLKWKDINSEWKNPIYDNDEFKMSEDEIQNKTFSVANYEFVDNLDIPDASIMSPTWSELSNVKWKDYAYVKWGHIVPDKERLAQFFINKIKAGETIQVGADRYTIPNDININEFERLAGLLSAETGSDISSFQYNPRIRKEKQYIDAVSKDDGSIGDRYVGSSLEVNIIGETTFSFWSDAGKTVWSDIPLTWNNAHRVAHAKSHSNPFTWDNTRSYRTRFSIPTMITVYMSIDNSKMAGKSKVKWTIKDNSRDYTILENVESLYFVYMFRQEGIYTIKAEITDSNGNTNTVTKEKMVRVYKTDRFKVLRKLNLG